VKTTGPALGRGAIEPIDVALFSQRSSHDADRFYVMVGVMAAPSS
jgi:hypothetical protein